MVSLFCGFVVFWLLRFSGFAFLMFFVSFAVLWFCVVFYGFAVLRFFVGFVALRFCGFVVFCCFAELRFCGFADFSYGFEVLCFFSFSWSRGVFFGFVILWFFDWICCFVGLCCLHPLFTTTKVCLLFVCLLVCLFVCLFACLLIPRFINSINCTI